ncbi:amidohydrolase family protein [Falsiroseomonas tokyonensis]|uniref:2-amino-3-carboxymuconate-6-semialdehyde decarboxylase n=1 Tax=Falsiroseomonas tokyonensis TaxID=430521 RepID=A0ABV7BWM5_9PROT|nr:amidohydrolase family protein [Falsiroseomonas tokyonensis]
MAQPAGPIDIHAHVVPGAFPARDLPGWPSMAPAEGGQRHVMIDGKPYRTVAARCWDVALRLADLDAKGLARQAISPMPELFSYWMPAEAAVPLLRHVNDCTAEMVAASGGRLIGLAALPMQDLDAALTEMRRAKEELGFAGVEIGSNINGTVIGDAALRPFFAAAEQLGMAVLVHPVRPAGMDRLVGPKNLQQALGYPSEIGLAAASVITSNLMLRHPALRLCFSHGGGTLASLLPRLEQAWHTFPALRDSIEEAPSAQARRFFVDALVFDAPMLRHLLGVMGPERLLLGTDDPFAFRENDPVGRIAEVLEPGTAREAVLRDNALSFLGLPA